MTKKKPESLCIRCRTTHHLFRRPRLCEKCNTMCCSWCVRSRTGICKICASPLRGLSDALLQYIESFLPVDDLDRFLRVCKWFQRLVLLPFPQTVSCADLYETCEVLHTNPNTGTVHHRALDRATRQWRTLKVVLKSSLYTRRKWQDFQHVLSLCFAIHHPNFVDIFSVHQTSTEVLIAYEFLELVPLEQLARHLTEKDIMHIGWQVLRAVKHLHHDQKVVHGSLETCLMVDANTLAVKFLMKRSVLQFGYSKEFPDVGEIMAALLATAQPPVANSTSRVFHHRYVAIKRPAPVIIPGGRDESLFRKCEKFKRAAVQRHAIVSSDTCVRRREFSGSFVGSVSSSSFNSFRGEERQSFKVYPRGLRLGYAAPELAEVAALNAPRVVTAQSLMACDMFTVGIILYWCFARCKPWTARNWRVMAHVMFNKVPTSLHILHPGISPEAIDLIASLLRRDPEKRITVKTALIGEWIKNGQSDYLLSPSSPPGAPRGPRPI